MPDFDLSGQVAVVTGAGRGIGAGIAQSLAEAGASVVLAARTCDEIEAVAWSINACGGRALAVTTDVTDRFALGSLATAAVDEFGHLDIWVNNAGGTTTSKPLAELTRREWNECLAVNLTAVWDGAMAAVEQMQWGSIVNISSVAAFGPVRGAGHYSACKAAVNSLTQTMAHELAPDIRVNAIAPGPVPTDHFFENIEAKDYPLADLTGRIPLGLGTPRDIGDAVVYLSSTAARWVTAQTLVVSGGLTSF